MNAQDRKELNRAIEMIDEGVIILGDLADSEMEEWENLPESIQGSEYGSEFEERADSFQSVADDINNALYDVEESL